MPINPTFPGVYIEEIPSGVRTITGVATSITAFIGRALRGLTNEPVTLNSFGDFVSNFGDLWDQSTLGYAVQHFYLNGGTQAIIVRVSRNATKATLKLGTDANALKLEAAGEGAWGNSLLALVDHKIDPSKDATKTFNLRVKDGGTGVIENFFNVSVDPSDPRYVSSVLEHGSQLVRVSGQVPPQSPPDSPAPDPGKDPFTKAYTTGNDGGDGDPITDAEISDPSLIAKKEGIWALDKADLFNLLCIPPLKFDTDIGTTTLTAALNYCQKHRAFFIIDPRSDWTSVANVLDSGIGIDSLNIRSSSGAIFFPKVNMPDPRKQNRLSEFVPCGIIAGIFARTDALRGVWKAPAGIDATLLGVSRLSVIMNDSENGELNPVGVNCLRTFPVTGFVLWGSRTLRGADQLSDDYKYIPVRRLALYIEESLYRGTQWVVFEPNDEPLWAQIRLNVGAFMQNLFRQGAFQGQTPKDAYFVKCDKETTTQNDINLGIVNIVVGFAPLKPAEFVIIQLQQMAGQIQV